MRNKEIADKIAANIFSLGDDYGEKIQRIQFMGGEYPDNEKPLGGLGIKSLTCIIFESLERYRDN